MTRSMMGPLMGFIRQLYGNRLRTKIDCPLESSINFIIGTDVGLLGVQIDCNSDEEGLKSMLFSVVPLLPQSDKTFGFYDLHDIDLAGYEMIDEIRGNLEWGSLTLDHEDGTKSPVLGRAEVLNPSHSFKDQDFARIGAVLEMLEFETVQIIPAIAALSSGILITREGVSLAMTEVYTSVQ